MKSPLNALRPFAEKQAQKTREELAALAFNLEAVKLAVIEAAVRGELAVKISIDKCATELRGTDAARALADWVAANKLTLEWVERLAERPNGLKAGIGEPVISWGDERHG
jgi:hypothetical protein